MLLDSTEVGGPICLLTTEDQLVQRRHRPVILVYPVKHDHDTITSAVREAIHNHTLLVWRTPQSTTRSRTGKSSISYAQRHLREHAPCHYRINQNHRCFIYRWHKAACRRSASMLGECDRHVALSSSGRGNCSHSFTCARVSMGRVTTYGPTDRHRIDTQRSGSR